MVAYHCIQVVMLTVSGGRTFVRKPTPHGVFESICAECFDSVAVSSEETELRRAENIHVCPGLDLGKLFTASKK